MAILLAGWVAGLFRVESTAVFMIAVVMGNPVDSKAHWNGSQGGRGNCPAAMPLERRLGI